MAKGKRAVQEDATPANRTGYTKAELSRLMELTLIIELALTQADRLKINRVRIPLIEKWDAQFLVAILKAEMASG